MYFLKSINYMIKTKFLKTTKIYEGIVLSENNNGTWNIKYNGEIHAIKPYGTNAPVINSLVKVFIPQGNQALSFFR